MLETRTIVVSLLVGTVVTVLAGLLPALRATRVPPIAAMREGVEIPPRPLPTRRRADRPLLLGLVRARGGRDLHGGHGARSGAARRRSCSARAGCGYACAAAGSAAQRYRVVPALARAIGVLVSWRGITGRLARENAMRQPGRTMVTAAALMVGLALVAFVSVLAAGTKATIDQAVSRSFAGNLIIENSQAGSEQGIPALVAPAVAQGAAASASVTPIAFTVGRLRGSSSENASITAVEPSSFVRRLPRSNGSRARHATLLGARRDAARC